MRFGVVVPGGHSTTCFSDPDWFFWVVPKQVLHLCSCLEGPFLVAASR